MKIAADRPFAIDLAARKLVEIANGVEAVQEWPHLHRAGQRAVSRGLPKIRHCLTIAFTRQACWLD